MDRETVLKKIRAGEPLEGADLRGLDLSGADLVGADLRDAGLRGANLERAVLEGAVLRGANLDGTVLVDAVLRGADLRGASLRFADLRDAMMDSANWQESAGQEPIAHPGDEHRPDEPLHLHLQRVALKARELAEACNPNDPVLALYAEAAGWIHDVGKQPEPWQEYLQEKIKGRQPPIRAHAYHGALLAIQEKFGALMMSVAGHHSGLADLETLKSLLQGGTRRPSDSDMTAIREWLKGHKIDPFADLPPCPVTDLWHREMWIRMLASILIDADRLATEYNEKGVYRPQASLDYDLLLERLTAAILKLSVTKGASDPTLLKARQNLLDSCIAHGSDPKGWFTLTGPTGSGKTLAGMMFALLHARSHKMRRVFVVVPFLTIIDQSVGTYRKALERKGESIILEHHSNAEGIEGTGHLPPATENWDAPVVLTTTVQFFESLLASLAGKIRKIHNIAGSVIILDEFQALPSECLIPITSVLDDLVKNWGCTVVLSSASQIDLGAITKFPVKTTELVPDPPVMFRALRRVAFHYDFLVNPNRSIYSLASELSTRHQALCVFNTKKKASDMYRVLKRLASPGAVLHLSANLCPDNRRDILEEVRYRLSAGKPCLLVATQVIEAGCDVDFPVAYRELCPLDGLVQTAGRVNREGKLNVGESLVVVFTLDDPKIPKGFYKRGTEITRDLLSSTLTPERLATDPSIFEVYFKVLLNNTASLDALNIQALRERLKYRTVWVGENGEGRFRLIGDDTVSVLVPYKKGCDLLKEFKQAQPVTRDLLRRMQPYLVSLYRKQYEKALEKGYVTQIRPDYDIACVKVPWGYDSELGLQVG